MHTCNLCCLGTGKSSHYYQGIKYQLRQPVKDYVGEINFTEHSNHNSSYKCLCYTGGHTDIVKGTLYHSLRRIHNEVASSFVDVGDSRISSTPLSYTNFEDTLMRPTCGKSLIYTKWTEADLLWSSECTPQLSTPESQSPKVHLTA